MIPLTVDPIVIIRINPDGTVNASATNVSPDLRIEVVTDEVAFREKALGKPFLKETRRTSLPS